MDLFNGFYIPYSVIPVSIGVWNTSGQFMDMASKHFQDGISVGMVVFLRTFNSSGVSIDRFIVTKVTPTAIFPIEITYDTLNGDITSEPITEEKGYICASFSSGSSFLNLLVQQIPTDMSEIIMSLDNSMSFYHTVRNRASTGEYMATNLRFDASKNILITYDDTPVGG